LILIGAGDRDRTGMDFHPRDFKSLFSHFHGSSPKIIDSP
jgi:hypothetical protein